MRKLIQRLYDWYRPPCKPRDLIFFSEKNDVQSVQNNGYEMLPGETVLQAIKRLEVERSIWEDGKA